jgi:hypothetical protein
MAVDWSGFRLAPDLSGLAQGIQGYFQNRQNAEALAVQQAMEERKMQLAEAELAARAQGGMGSAFAPQVSTSTNLYQGNDKAFYRPQVIVDRNTLQTRVQYVNETTGQVISPEDAAKLNLKLTTTGIATAPQAAAAQGTIAKQTEIGRGEGQQQVAAGVEEQKKLGQQKANLLQEYRDSAKNASKKIKTITELDMALADINTGKIPAAYAKLKNTFGFDASGFENADAAVFTAAKEVLSQETGTKTDFDFTATVDTLANSGRHKEANRLIIERLRRNAQYDIENSRAFNRWRNKGNDPLDYVDIDYLEFVNSQGKKKNAETTGSNPASSNLIWNP